MSRNSLYLIAHRTPLGGEPLAEPAVVATITVDDRFVGKLNPKQQLEVLAGKLGLVDFDILPAEAMNLPGFQLGLPFPNARRPRRS